MLRIALCDDDNKTLEFLENAINYILCGNVSISKHTNPFSLITYIVDDVKGEIDLVFIDIKLREQNGIQVAKTILNHYFDIKIIFITSYLERVKDIFQISPLYFLLKPIEISYLQDALYKAIEMIDEESLYTLIIKSKTDGHKIQIFKIKDIYYIESEMRVLHIHESSHSKSIYMKLDDMEQELPGNFCRCHQSYIVNMDKIKKVTAREIFLFNDAVIPISRSRKNTVMGKISKYLEYKNQ